MALCVDHLNTQHLLQNLVELSREFAMAEQADDADTFETMARTTALGLRTATTTENIRPLSRASTFGQNSQSKRSSDNAVKHYKEV
jgi:hypothetical protein